MVSVIFRWYIESRVMRVFWWGLSSHNGQIPRVQKKMHFWIESQTRQILLNIGSFISLFLMSLHLFTWPYFELKLCKITTLSYYWGRYNITIIATISLGSTSCFSAAMAGNLLATRSFFPVEAMVRIIQRVQGWCMFFVRVVVRALLAFFPNEISWYSLVH